MIHENFIHHRLKTLSIRNHLVRFHSAAPEVCTELRLLSLLSTTSTNAEHISARLLGDTHFSLYSGCHTAAMIASFASGSVKSKPNIRAYLELSPESKEYARGLQYVKLSAAQTVCSAAVSALGLAFCSSNACHLVVDQEPPPVVP